MPAGDLKGHESRVLYTALSPDGKTVCPTPSPPSGVRPPPGPSGGVRGRGRDHPLLEGVRPGAQGGRQAGSGGDGVLPAGHQPPVTPGRPDAQPFPLPTACPRTSRLRSFAVRLAHGHV